MENLVSFSISEASKTIINNHYSDLDKEMSFLVALNTSEKRSYLNLSDKQAGITAKVIEWLRANPTRFTETNRDELEKDLNGRTDLTAIKARHDEFGAKLESTITRSSQEVMFEMRLLKRAAEIAFERDASIKPLKTLLEGLFER